VTATCRCTDEALLWGVPADDYSTDHLVRDVVAEGGQRIVYRCPDTGRRWIGEFVDDDRGVTSFRLRQALRAAELVELLVREPPPYHDLTWTDPEVEFRPPGSDTVYRGYEQAREWADRAVRDPSFPRPTALSMIEVREDEVVVLGSVAFKRGGEYHEHRPSAWLVTTREGRILRSLWFDSWSEARKAAGVSESAPAAKRLGRWVFARLARVAVPRQQGPQVA
jgi:hypothetical protein